MSAEAIIGLVVGGIFIPLITWNVATLIRVNTILFGANGDNGLNGDLKVLREAREDHEQRLRLLEHHEAHG